MAKKKKPKKRKHSGYIPPETGIDEKAIDAIREIHHRLVEGDSASAGPVWGEVHHALLKTQADKKLVMRIIASRDADELSRLIDALAIGKATPEEPASPCDAPSVPVKTVDPEQTKHAMRAFRKRLKLTRLDDESRISVSPMTGGKSSQIRAILPPHEYERDIWDELVRQGKLRNVGQGFYELAE